MPKIGDKLYRFEVASSRLKTYTLIEDCSRGSELYWLVEDELGRQSYYVLIHLYSTKKAALQHGLITLKSSLKETINTRLELDKVETKLRNLIKELRYF